MQQVEGIKPDACLVDLLGTVGQFDLALKTIQEMSVQVQAQVWAPLLSACRKHSNIELGKLAARKLAEIFLFDRVLILCDGLCLCNCVLN
ncbi:hypothetical protein Patl1_10241 [Pistacia atlantica]|uniref:Uncharacterized protein n=1 Tax=Pistacia atlantica TaxID=434234 RepID=A0ACC1A470_9ROSI|nr:hypothetical protein Patl1_10241 [Pistacia atlantica]